MAMRLEKENVRIIFMDILDECDLYCREGKEAEHLLDYIAGVKDMANEELPTGCRYRNRQRR